MWAVWIYVPVPSNHTLILAIWLSHCIFTSVGIDNASLPCHQWSIAQQLTHVTGWQHVAVLQEQGNNCSDQIFQAKPNSKPVTVIAEEVCSQNRVLSQDLLILAARERKINRFLLAVSSTCLRNIFTTISSLERYNQGYFSYMSQWIILADDKTENEKQRLFLLNHVVMVSRNGKIYSLLKNGTIPVMSEIRTEIRNNVITREDIFPNQLCGFCGHHFTVATQEYSSFTDKMIVDGKVVYKGYIVSVMDMLAEIHNFSYTFKEPADGEWGAVKNGSWTGLVAMVITKEADFSCAASTITSERDEVVDFPYPFFRDYKAVFVRKTSLAEQQWKLYIQPFKFTVWIAVALGVLLTSAMLWTFSVKMPSRTWPRTLSDNTLFVYGALICQGSPYMPKATSARVLIGCWWIFSLVLVATYTGNLVAFLAVDKDGLPFNSVEEMVDQDDIRYGFMSGTSFETFLRNHGKSMGYQYERLLQKVDEFKRDDPDVNSRNYKVHVTKLLRGGYAAIFDKTGMTKMLNENRNVGAFDAGIPARHYSLMFPERSVYVQMFSETIISMWEAGFIDKWMEDYWPKKYRVNPKMNQIKRVALSDVHGAFFVTGSAVIIATLVLLYEGLVHKYQTTCITCEATASKLSNIGRIKKKM